MPNKVEKRQIEYSNTKQGKLIKGFGPYQYFTPTQDQIIAYLDGMRISGTFKKRGDSQSDYTANIPTQLESEEFHALLDLVNQHVKEALSNRDWKIWKSFVEEEMMDSVEVEEQVDSLSIETTDYDVVQLTPEQLASAILNPQAESDIPRLREMILIAEDTSFTIDENKELSQWLLSFAERYRDSSEPQDEAAVWAAIRTGASMLRPEAAGRLRSLLEPGHSIETSLVTVKMLGRIFEAQPPADVDEHQDLADEVYQIAESLLNQYAITASQSAAMAHLAIYALAAMASSKTEPIVKAVRELGVMWFTRRTHRKLSDLSNIWASHPTGIMEAPRQLLDKLLQMLERD
jgi:hypothetical protein